MNPSLRYFSERIQPKLPLTLIDVGAMGGIPKKWDALAGLMKVIAFEPDPREFAKLSGTPMTTYLNCALWDKSESLKYYMARSTGKSSFYQPNPDVISQFEDEERYATIKEEILPAARVKNLDTVLRENNISDCDFIKLDTQGSELKILQGGANEAVPQMFGANIEVEFAQTYQGQALFRHVDEFMTSHGFELIDLRRAFWKRKDYYDYVGKGQLVFGDALYFKKGEVLSWEIFQSVDKEYSRNKIYKAIVICLVYRMYDYAVMLANIAKKMKLFSDEEHHLAVEAIKRDSTLGVWPDFFGKTFLYKVFSRLSQKLQPRSYLGWADGDKTIGNVKDI